jgi:hypothetical protein
VLTERLQAVNARADRGSEGPPLLLTKKLADPYFW